MKGKYKFKSSTVKELPDYYFLPYPDKVKSDFPDISYLSIIFKGDYIYWNVTWFGKKKCDQVLKEAKANLDKWIMLNHIYLKIEKFGGNEEYTKPLIKNSGERIKHWTDVVNDILYQVKTS